MEAINSFAASSVIFSVYMVVLAVLRLGLGVTLAVLAIKCMLKYLKKDES